MKHTNFIYHSYSITNSGFEFHFSMDEYEFRPKWSYAFNTDVSLNDPILNELVFNLGMVELISYWKSACPPIVEVRCGSLDEWQIKWWKKLYRNGLGEFFYVNGIVPPSNEDFMRIHPPVASDIPPHGGGQLPPIPPHGGGQFPPVASDTPPHGGGVRQGCLIPVGGGKDSIVTLELLRESMGDNYCYIIGNIKRAYDSAKMAGYPDSRIIKVSRTIDPVLLELNRKGYLNGHTPFSAIVAFSSVIFAYLSGKKYVVLSNESSANEGNVKGSEVNHQYSKSIEFEQDFRTYIRRITAEPEYFSLLRPWNELQIAERFTRFPQYFPVFQSCNAGTKSNTWCCKCAKCLYVYVMLSAFLDDETLVGIFGENLLENPDLADLLEALANPDFDKPFECVGTREEVNHALFMALKRRKGSPLALPLLMRKCVEKIKPSDTNLMKFFDDVNFVPQELISFLSF